MRDTCIVLAVKNIRIIPLLQPVYTRPVARLDHINKRSACAKVNYFNHTFGVTTRRRVTTSTRRVTTRRRVTTNRPRITFLGLSLDNLTYHFTGPNLEVFAPPLTIVIPGNLNLHCLFFFCHHIKREKVHHQRNIYRLSHFRISTPQNRLLFVILLVFSEPVPTCYRIKYAQSYSVLIALAGHRRIVVRPKKQRLAHLARIGLFRQQNLLEVRIDVGNLSFLLLLLAAFIRKL